MTRTPGHCVLPCSVSSLQSFWLTGADVNLEDCSYELQYGSGYNVDLDLPAQRAALLSIYNSTGGPFWTWTETISESSHATFFQLVADIIQFGEGLSDPGQYNYTALLSIISAPDVATLQALSVQCQLQQALGFGQLLLNHVWGEAGESYCQWHGELASHAAIGLMQTM